jgi:hypothetical protein
MSTLVTLSFAMIVVLAIVLFVFGVWFLYLGITDTFLYGVSPTFMSILYLVIGIILIVVALALGSRAG